MKFSREQYLELMTCGSSERRMFVELFGPMVGLEKEWKAQGATKDEINLTAFDWDYVPVVECGGNTGFFGGEKRRIIEETKEYVIERDELGRRLKLYKSSATIPLPLEYPVRDTDDWLKIKPLLEFRKERIDRDAVEKAKGLQKKGYLVVATIPGGFDYPRQLMGAENACISYHKQPDLMHDIMKTITDTTFHVLDRVSDMLVIDQLSVPEDLAGRSGPIIGPGIFETFIKRYYRKIWDMLSSKGTKIFNIDTDGNVSAILDVLLESGINSMNPFEAAAGMDIVEVRKTYGRKLVMRGGINKFVLRESKKAILKELEYRMQPLMQSGGIAFGLDHRILDGTPLENYRYYVDTGREILGLPPRDSKKKGWKRMAF